MATNPTIIVSDPSVRPRATGGTFSSVASTPQSTVRAPTRFTAQAAPAIPAMPGSTGYGRSTQQPTFSAAAAPPTAPALPKQPSFSEDANDPKLDATIKAKFTPPVCNEDYSTDRVYFPYVYQVGFNYVTTTTVNNPAGANNEVQYNANGAFGGDTGLTFDPGTNSLSVGGNISSPRVITDNLFYSNGNPWVFAPSYDDSNVATFLTTYTGLLGGTLTTNAQPNVTSVGTLSTLNVTGNVAVGAILTDNIYYANGDPRPSGGGGGTLSISPAVFRGTGLQTVYNLPINPNGANNTQIFIFGVYQQKATYTVVGTTLTFSMAPPAPPQAGDPDNIEVLIYRMI